MFEVFIKKADRKYSVDFDSLPSVSQNRVIEYGLTQILSDAAASVATTDIREGRRIPLSAKALEKARGEAAVMVEARLSDLSNGILRRVRETDAVAAEARKIAIRLVNKSADFRQWLAANGHKATDKPAIEELAKRAGERAKAEDVLSIAEKHVAELEALS